MRSCPVAKKLIANRVKPVKRIEITLMISEDPTHRALQNYIESAQSRLTGVQVGKEASKKQIPLHLGQHRIAGRSNFGTYLYPARSVPLPSLHKHH